MQSPQPDALPADASEYLGRSGGHRATSQPWWQRAVIYQIYPRSFQDANGDGVGDLEGIRSRLDYLTQLGVDAIWISPIYPSPMADGGYDICDYCDVDPSFGTLADVDRLLVDLHRRGMKLILDFVPNHSSDRHPWFLRSRATRTDPMRDWYVWRDPGPDGGPPNNWLSEFGGPAWTLDPRTGQYYYHAYLAQQPDLNWRHPPVVDAMLAVLRFWLDRGVDGFRVDAIHHLFEATSLADNPPNPGWHPQMAPARRLIRQYTMDQPEVHAAIVAMRRTVDAYGDRLLIGEAYLPFDRLMTYYGAAQDEFHLPFNFHLMSCPWRAEAIAATIDAYEAALPAGAWPNWVLGNHDRSRVASRIGSRQARVAAMLLLTLRGTPTLYQGDEIGLRDVPIAPDRVRDPWERNVPGLGLGRDPVRTPLPWHGGPGAGFTSGEPWLPLNDDAATVNIAAQLGDPASMLALVRSLLQLRRAEPALVRGGYRTVMAADGVLIYDRRLRQRRLRVILNLTGAPRRVSQEQPAGLCLLSTHDGESCGVSGVDARVSDDGVLALRPDEGRIFAWQEPGEESGDDAMGDTGADSAGQAPPIDGRPGGAASRAGMSVAEGDA